MNVRHDRIARVQAGMRDEGLVAIVIVNHDDYRYLFGTDRVQPRAIIPVEGPPTLIAFAGEEPEILAALAEAGKDALGGEVLVFGSVGGQIHEVVGLLRDLVARIGHPEAERPRSDADVVRDPGLSRGAVPEGQPRHRGRLIGPGDGPAPDDQGRR